MVPAALVSGVLASTPVRPDVGPPSPASSNPTLASTTTPPDRAPDSGNATLDATHVSDRAGSPPPPASGVAPPAAPEPADDSFDWKHAKCPAPTAEHTAFVLSPVVPRSSVPLRTIVALREAPGQPVEVALRGEKSTFAVTRLTPIEVLDHHTYGFDGAVVLPSRFVTWMLRVGPEVVACRRLATDDEVERGAGPRVWGPEAESLYSLWAARLLSFERWESFESLTALTRESSRNILLGRLGTREDDEASPLGKKSDCADFPLSLRAYFSWKLELPFGVYREPNRQDNPPAPSAPTTNREENMGRELDLLLDGHEPRVTRALFSKKLYRLQNGISSGLLRTERSSEDTNLYPVALEQSSLRPGSPYVDPFTHVSVLAGWEKTDKGAQRLWVADAQPSGLITIHPYVPGAIVFRPGKASAGFKWFRTVRTERDGSDVPLSNARLSIQPEVELRPAYAELARTEESFHERLEYLQDPRPRDPIAAYQELYEGLIDGLQNRVRFIQEGWTERQRRTSPMEMPATEDHLFASEGDWEAFSTPCRDLRLLTRLKQLAEFPSVVEKHPQRYEALEGEDQATRRARLEAARDAWAARPAITYTRSDGSSFTLSLAEVLSRVESFEAAYNPNDCPEIRWGADPSSPEASTCTLRAPDAQTALMNKFRFWFRQRYVCA